MLYLNFLDIDQEESIIDKTYADLLIKEGTCLREEFRKKITQNEIIYTNAKSELRKSLMNEKWNSQQSYFLHLF